MATMNVSMPEAMRAWVQNQIEGGKYASSSDYVRDLIRQDQLKADKLHALQTALTEWFKSGIGSKSMDELLAEARQQTQQSR